MKQQDGVLPIRFWICLVCLLSAWTNIYRYQTVPLYPRVPPSRKRENNNGEKFFLDEFNSSSSFFFFLARFSSRISLLPIATFFILVAVSLFGKYVFWKLFSFFRRDLIIENFTAANRIFKLECNYFRCLQRVAFKVKYSFKNLNLNHLYIYIASLNCELKKRDVDSWKWFFFFTISIDTLGRFFHQRSTWRT